MICAECRAVAMENPVSVTCKEMLRVRDLADKRMLPTSLYRGKRNDALTMVGQVGATLRENSALVEKQPYVANADVMRPFPRLDQPSTRYGLNSRRRRPLEGGRSSAWDHRQ